jgi:hypothetical protein
MRDFDMSMGNGAMGDEDDSKDTVWTDEDGKLHSFKIPDTSIYNTTGTIRFRNGSQMIVDNKTSGIFTVPESGTYEISGIGTLAPNYTITLPDGLTLDKEKIDGLLASFDSIKETSCNHSWKTYTGLNTMFDYCEVCDAKKNERKG